LNAEDVICSKITFKILKALAKFGQLNVTSLADDVGTGAETYKRLQIPKGLPRI
jgi:predicted transcriptional regulator